MVLTKNLNKISYKDTGLVGGKAASLGSMVQAGLPVPPGFVVTTDAYRLFAKPLANEERPPHASANAFYSQMLKSFDRLGVAHVAVRSSAVAEDSADASWAGQLESYLNVTKDGLIDAVQKCWQSIESDRARQYADSHNVEKSERAVAVLVQQMVESEISGVMFTDNPVTSNPNEIMIEAVYGLGEMIVQGIVTPESLVVNKTNGRILSRSQHRQQKQLTFKNGKNVESRLDPALQDQDILSDKQITELINLAQRIESYYHSPQDIEWAMANDKIYIVQSHPITTLSNESVDEVDMNTNKGTIKLTKTSQ